MKVCYILPHFYPHIGGGEKAMLEYILAILNKDVEVRVLTHSDNGKSEHINYMGIDIYYFNWKILFGHPIVNSNDIKEHIMWADIVHTATYTPVPTVSRVCKRINKPLVVTVYESLNEKWYWIEPNFIKATMFKTYERFVLKHWCSCYHSISEATTKDLKKIVSTKPIKKIYCIVDRKDDMIEEDREKLVKFFSIDKSDKIFLSYGRPGKTKGLFVYLDAIIKTLKSLPEHKTEHIKFCFIMSNDPVAEKNKFIKIVKDNALEKNIIVRDSVSREDLDTYIKSCDYVVVPSITEGFGLTAIEACDMGKKVIYSSAGSLPEVTFGETVEFKNRNSDDLSDKLNKIILNEIEFSKKQQKDFSYTTISNQLYDLYEQLILEKKQKKGNNTRR